MEVRHSYYWCTRERRGEKTHGNKLKRLVYNIIDPYNSPMNSLLLPLTFYRKVSQMNTLLKFSDILQTILGVRDGVNKTERIPDFRVKQMYE